MKDAIDQAAVVRFSDLYRTVSEELALHGEMLLLLKEAQALVVTGSAERLLETVHAMNACLLPLAATRLRRDRILREIAGELGQPPATPASRLISFLPDELRAHWGTRVTEINELLISSKECLQKNQILLVQHLQQMNAADAADTTPVASSSDSEVASSLSRTGARPLAGIVRSPEDWA